VIDAAGNFVATLNNVTELLGGRYDLPIGTYVVGVSTSLWSRHFNLSRSTVLTNVLFAVVATCFTSRGTCNVTPTMGACVRQ